jgi:hypothetical protein
MIKLKKQSILKTIESKKKKKGVVIKIMKIKLDIKIK